MQSNYSSPARIAAAGFLALGLCNQSLAQQWRSLVPPVSRISAAAAFDSQRGRTVLFGGSIGASRLGDTWERAGGQWIPVSTPTAPPARELHTMAYDDRRGVIVLFGGLTDAGLSNDTWEFDGVTWTQVPTTAAPAARWGHAMVYDALRGVTVLFGGSNATGFQNDTWEYDGNTATWTQAAVPAPPMGRYRAAMAYDAVNGVSVMFGGISSTGYMNDTWVYDGNTATWTNVSPTASPSARIGHAMVFDSARSVTVLFGGLSGSLLPQNDTWAYDSTRRTWTQVLTANAPSPRNNHAMAYDAARQQTVLFGGQDRRSMFQDTWSYNGSDWSLAVVVPTAPPSRSHTNLVFDGGRQSLLLFGGQHWNGAWGNLNDTWELQGATWTQVQTTGAPPARGQHGIVYDARRGRTVVFGGGLSWGTPPVIVNDTWEYDSNTQTWTQITTANVPAPRASCTMVYDAAREVTVLFGGLGYANGQWVNHGDTWEYDGADWTRITTANAPSPRFVAACCYDAGRGVVVQFGAGALNASGTAFTNLGDTWEYDGRANPPTWTQITTANAPAPQTNSRMVYDPARGRCLFTGGFINPPITWFDITWEYDGAANPPTWTRIPVTLSQRGASAFAYDPVRGKAVLFGGFASGSPVRTLDDLWEFQPAPQAMWTTYGFGCPGSNGTPTLSPVPGSLPLLGSTFGLSVANLTTNPGLLFVANGLAIGQLSGLPLPLDLGSAGLVGCQLWVGFGTGISYGLSHNGSTAAFSVAIPNNVVLAGLQVATQVLSIDPAGPGGIGAMSNAGIATVQ